MAAAPNEPRLANPIVVCPVSTTANGTFVQIGNQQKRFIRSSTIGATVIFKTENAARNFFELLRDTELRLFGRSIGTEQGFQNNQWFIDIHGDTRAILAAVKRIFDGSVTYGQGAL